MNAVLFDFDGTLARTMEDNFNAWKAVAGQYGVELKPEDYYPIEGTRVDELAQRFFDSARFSDSQRRELAVQKDRYYLDHHRFEFYPGVEAFVGRLRTAGVRMAMVTAGHVDRITNSVPSGFIKQFDLVVMGNMTREGKPSPEPDPTLS